MATPERYAHIDLTPPEGVQSACANGVERAEAGEGGDGLEDVTIREARAMARGEAISWAKAKKLMAWWARNERFLDASQPSAAWTAAQLWGGRAGRDWANSLRRQRDAADTDGADNSEGMMQTMTITVDTGTTVSLAEADVLEDVLIFRWGEVDHPAGAFEVDTDFAAQMLASYEAMRAEGYLPPVLAEHEPSGGGYGRVVGMRVTNEGIVVDLELAEGVREEVDAGRRIYISPSFYPEFRHPNTGEELRFALREISFVSVPHLKNLPPLGQHYSLSESGWATTTTKMEADMATTITESPTEAPVDNEEHEDKDMGASYDMGDMRKDLAEMRKDMMEGLGAVMDLLKSVMDDAEDEGEPVEDSEAGEPSQLSEMAARVAELVRENAELDIQRRLGDVSDERRERLVRLRIQSREVYEDAVTALSEAAASRPKPSATPERGGGSTATVAPKATKLAEQARAEGVPRGAKAITYLTNRGVDMSEAVDAIASVYC